MRRVTSSTAWVSVFALLFITGCAETNRIDKEALEQEYLARFQRVLNNGGFLKGYEPMEPLRGVDTLSALPKYENVETVIDTSALDRARAYAADNNSDAFIVWYKGRLLTEDYFGESSATTPLVSKSLSKPLTAIAIGRAIQLGKIASLDQPVSDFINEWQGSPKQDVLVRHLLDMRAGFLKQGYSPDPSHPWNRAYLSPDHGSVLIEEYPLVQTPGAQYLYNNATSDMVALLIERATGERYGEFISEQVLKKIGAPGGLIWVSRKGGLAHSGCCKYLPAQSWLRMAMLLINDGVVDNARLLPEGFVNEMKTATEQNPHYGLGIWVAGEYVERRAFVDSKTGPQVLHSEPFLDPNTFMFDGNANQVIWIMPKYELIVARLGKRPPKAPEWDNSYLPNLIVRSLQN